MFFITMAVAPLLVRHGEHVAVEILASWLGPSRRRILAAFVHVVCIALCFILAWFAFAAALDAAGRGEIDMRSIDMPRWVLYAMLGGGLSLCGLEFILLMTRAVAPPGERGPRGSF
jgi:TRAP-type C4-dicarboxylate transport system permease small subunit